MGTADPKKECPSQTSPFPLYGTAVADQPPGFEPVQTCGWMFSTVRGCLNTQRGQRRIRSGKGSLFSRNWRVCVGTQGTLGSVKHRPSGSTTAVRREEETERRENRRSCGTCLFPEAVNVNNKKHDRCTSRGVGSAIVHQDFSIDFAIFSPHSLLNGFHRYRRCDDRGPSATRPCCPGADHTHDETRRELRSPARTFRQSSTAEQKYSKESFL